MTYDEQQIEGLVEGLDEPTAIELLDELNDATEATEATDDIEAQRMAFLDALMRERGGPDGEGYAKLMRIAIGQHLLKFEDLCSPEAWEKWLLNGLQFHLYQNFPHKFKPSGPGDAPMASRLYAYAKRHARNFTKMLTDQRKSRKEEPIELLDKLDTEAQELSVQRNLAYKPEVIAEVHLSSNSKVVNLYLTKSHAEKLSAKLATKLAHLNATIVIKPMKEPESVTAIGSRVFCPTCKELRVITEESESKTVTLDCGHTRPIDSRELTVV